MSVKDSRQMRVKSRQSTVGRLPALYLKPALSLAWLFFIGVYQELQLYYDAFSKLDEEDGVRLDTS